MAYRRSIHIKAREILAERKEKAEREQKQRHDEICLKFPEILALERKMAKTGAEAVRAIGMGADAQSFLEQI